MNLFLYFLVIPIAVILAAIALEKLLDSPILVGAIIFITSLIAALTAFMRNAYSNINFYCLWNIRYNCSMAGKYN